MAKGHSKLKGKDLNPGNLSFQVHTPSHNNLLLPNNPVYFCINTLAPAQPSYQSLFNNGERCFQNMHMRTNNKTVSVIYFIHTHRENVGRKYIQIIMVIFKWYNFIGGTSFCFTVFSSFITINFCYAYNKKNPKRKILVLITGHLERTIEHNQVYTLLTILST